MARSKTPNSYERQMHRSMKRDALRQNRLSGCRCVNVKARVVQPDASLPDLTVITAPHVSSCPLQRAAVEQEDTRYAAMVEPTGTPLAVPPVGANELWTPGG